MSAAEVLDASAPPARATASPLGWLRFLRSELGIIFGRRRNLAGIAVLAVVPIVLAIAVKVSSPTGGGGGPDFISAITGNGLFVAFAALTLEIPIFLPLAVGVIAGDSVAGEANIGTLRYLLTIPAGRTRLLAVKFAAIAISALVATLVVAGVGTAMGLALFGGGPMTLLSGTQTSMADGVGRLLLSVAYVGCGLSALGAIGLFVSTLTEQPIGATIATMILTVVSFILDQLPRLEWLGPYLPTHYWMDYGELLRDPVAFSALRPGLFSAACYIVIFLTAAWARFAGKDVSS